jgi:hypothetical protein
MSLIVFTITNSFLLDRNSFLKVFLKKNYQRDQIASDNIQSCSKVNLYTNNNQRSIIFKSFLFLFLFGTSKCEASPLNKQLISINGPFFQGWLVRNTDHTKNLSFILIVGSFSFDKSSSYDEHYLFCGLNAPNYEKQAECFPSSSSVAITGGARLGDSGISKGLNVTWSAKNIGKFEFNDNCCRGKFHFSDSDLLLEFNATNRIPWGGSGTGKESGNLRLDGPEGWLGYTPFLPCHYFVHSVGSSCAYSVTCGDEKGKKKNFEGSGFAHIEGNYGTFFPEGWVWSQAVAENNAASFSLVAGKFLIAGFSSMNVIVYLRRRNGKTAVFRTTDLDSTSFSIDRTRGNVRIKAESNLRPSKQRLLVSIDAQLPTEINFGPAISIPTAKGFSNLPGCKETYTARITVTLFDITNKKEEKYLFNLAALEFGGTFVEQNEVFSNNKSF